MSKERLYTPVQAPPPLIQSEIKFTQITFRLKQIKTQLKSIWHQQQEAVKSIPNSLLSPREHGFFCPEYIKLALMRFWDRVPCRIKFLDGFNDWSRR